MGRLATRTGPTWLGVEATSSFFTSLEVRMASTQAGSGAAERVARLLVLPSDADDFLSEGGGTNEGSLSLSELDACELRLSTGELSVDEGPLATEVLRLGVRFAHEAFAIGWTSDTVGMLNPKRVGELWRVVELGELAPSEEPDSGSDRGVSGEKTSSGAMQVGICCCWACWCCVWETYEE
jgi:hypothetical protein